MSGTEVEKVQEVEQKRRRNAWCVVTKGRKREEVALPVPWPGTQRSQSRHVSFDLASTDDLLAWCHVATFTRGHDIFDLQHSSQSETQRGTLPTLIVISSTKQNAVKTIPRCATAVQPAPGCVHHQRDRPLGDVRWADTQAP